MSANKLKEEGNAFFKLKDYENAYLKYSEAISLDSNNHIHYSNRYNNIFYIKNH